MSGHHPFRDLVSGFSPEQVEAIKQKKQELAQIELHELLSSAISSWETDPTLTPVENVESCLKYLQQIVVKMGGELAVTARFPDDIEVKIDLPTMSKTSVRV